MKKEYDIFISYRRNPGADSAKHLHDILVQKGYRAFFDTDSLRSGAFNTELLRVIQECDDFIIILTPGALDRCANEGDWVRQELTCALEHNKNIVPIISAGFTFPENLPQEIEAIRYMNGINANAEYFDAVVAKLLTFLTTKPLKVKLVRRVIPAIIASVIIALAAVGIMDVLKGTEVITDAVTENNAAKQTEAAIPSTEAPAPTEAHPDLFPATQAEKNILSDAIAYTTKNFGYLNIGLNFYDNLLNEAEAYYQGNSKALNKKELLMYIDSGIDLIQTNADKLTPMSEALSSQMNDTILPKGDFTAVPDVLHLQMDNMAHSLELMKYFVENSVMTTETCARIIENWKTESDLYEQYYFVELNMLFSKVDRAAMKDFLTRDLANLTRINSLNMEWSTDWDTLVSRENLIWQKIEQNFNNYATLIGTQQNVLDWERLNKKISIDVYSSEHINAPTKEDTFSQLWEKLEYCLGDGPSNLIHNNLLAMREKVSTNAEVALFNAVREYQKCRAELPYNSGSVIAAFSNGASHPTLQEGDIIVAVNGTPVKSTAEIAKAKKAAGGDSWTFTVLRIFINEDNTEDYMAPLDVTVTKDGPTWTARTLEPLHR